MANVRVAALLLSVLVISGTHAASYEGAIRCDGLAVQEEFDSSKKATKAQFTYIFSFGSSPKVREIGNTNEDMFGSSKESTYNLKDVRITDNEIRAKIRYNFLNTHSVVIDRNDASAKVSGINYTFNGSCRKQNRL